MCASVCVCVRARIWNFVFNFVQELKGCTSYGYAYCIIRVTWWRPLNWLSIMINDCKLMWMAWIVPKKVTTHLSHSISITLIFCFAFILFFMYYLWLIKEFFYDELFICSYGSLAKFHNCFNFHYFLEKKVNYPHNFDVIAFNLNKLLILAINPL